MGRIITVIMFRPVLIDERPVTKRRKINDITNNIQYTDILLHPKVLDTPGKFKHLHIFTALYLYMYYTHYHQMFTNHTPSCIPISKPKRENKRLAVLSNKCLLF